MVALYAALCMLIQDIFGTLMVQAEARNHGWLAGMLDSLMWLFSIATTTITVTALQGHNTREKIIVIAAVTMANLLGAQLGVLVGKKLIKEAA